MNDLEADLLIANAKIEQLEEQLAAERAKYAELQRYNVDCTKQCGILQMDKVNLQTLLAESQRRERAAVEDLKRFSACCQCNANIDGSCCDMFDGTAENKYFCSNWQWRGPQEAEKGESHETNL